MGWARTVLSSRYLFINGRESNEEAEDEQQSVVDEPGDKKLSFVIERAKHEANVH